MNMTEKKHTPLASLGQFGLIDRLVGNFAPQNASTLTGAGDDAAVVMPPDGEAVLCTTDLLLEGVDFDLTYFCLLYTSPSPRDA